MKKIVVLITLVLVSHAASSKTVADFIKDHPELAKNPVIKTAIQQGAIGNAGMDAVSNGSTNENMITDAQRLLADNGYEYAQSALRELATTGCSEQGIADIYGLREKDCKTIIKVDAEID